MNSYAQGTTVKCRMLFYQDAAKTTLADPTTVKFRKRTPAGVITEHVYLTDAGLVRASTGDYYDNVDTDAAGVWEYAFEGTGTVDVVEKGKFEVTRTIFQD